MENQVKSAQSGPVGAEADGAGDKAAIERFLQGWAPFGALPPGSRARTSLLRFLAAQAQEERQRALQYASPLYRIQSQYEKLGILRADRPADPFAELLSLEREKLALAIRQGTAQDLLALLQRAFEFGRTPVPPAQQAARTFLQEFWSLQAHGPNMKYCLYPSGIPYSGGGKTHEEMARQFVSDGLGGGQPQCGGQIARDTPLDFTFDLSSTAFRGGSQPDAVRQAVLRSIRATGGDDAKVVLNLLASGR